MSAYDSELQNLNPGNTAEFVAGRHVIHVTATKQVGWNTGRLRYMVECITCKVLLHEATTGPDHYIAEHVRSAG